MAGQRCCWSRAADLEQLEPDVASCAVSSEHRLIGTTAWLSAVGQTGYGSWVTV
jgi:hypothetical protein